MDLDSFEIRVRCPHTECGCINLVKIGPTQNQIRCSGCNNVLLDYTPIHGYVYILSNEQMPGLLKIGFTERDVEQRVTELSSGTGVPGPFITEAYFATETPEEHERQIHRQMAVDRIPGKEFFRADLQTTLRVASKICGCDPEYVRNSSLVTRPTTLSAHPVPITQPTAKSPAPSEQTISAHDEQAAQANTLPSGDVKVVSSHAQTVLLPNMKK